MIWIEIEITVKKKKNTYIYKEESIKSWKLICWDKSWTKGNQQQTR